MSEQLERPSSIVAEINNTNLKIENWRGFGVLTGPGHDTHIFDEIQRRRRKIEQNMILIVGSPGQGKSYFGLRLAEIFDPDFDPALQIVFEQAHLLYLIGATSPLKRGQVLLIDEAQFIAGARNWFTEVQKSIMEHIEAIRSRGWIVIIVALHMNLLDKVIRNYVLSMMMAMQKRGTAQVYMLWTPTFEDKLYKKRMGKLSLKLPDWEKCKFNNCLICKYLTDRTQRCYSLRAVYERAKTAFLGKMSNESQQKVETQNRRKRQFDINVMINKLVAKSNELKYGKDGKVNTESIKVVFENEGISLTDPDIRRIVKRGMLDHADIFQKPKEVKKDE